MGARSDMADTECEAMLAVVRETPAERLKVA